MATYAMDTQSGDILVDGIVQTAIRNNFDYDWVYNILCILSDSTEEFAGATDTMVREAVIMELEKNGVDVL